MIRTFDYQRSLRGIEGEVLEAVRRVLSSGSLMLGPETTGFEEEFAAYVGARACIGVSSGTTALHLALLGLGVGPGDEVVTVSNTCAPTVAAIRLTGATPVFVDVLESNLLMDPARVAQALTERTRCIVPVHLWGHAVDLDALTELARDRGVTIVEDCAQAHGTRYHERHVGTFGRVGCFSFYPTKNIGAYGDAGGIVTDDEELGARLRAMRMYGYDDAAVAEVEGMNARIAELQAAILRIKLRVFPDWLARRREIAALYDASIAHPDVRTPAGDPSSEASYHQYVVRTGRRAELIEALRAAEIGFGIHYPTPVHRMPAYAFLDADSAALGNTERAAGEILSLPIHEALELEEARRVAECVNSLPATEAS
jgi:aminotransferase EvaB